MLKNDGGVLPLRGSIALVGPNATVITTGGGSGNVVPFSSTPVSEALKKDEQEDHNAYGRRDL